MTPTDRRTTTPDPTGQSAESFAMLLLHIGSQAPQERKDTAAGQSSGTTERKQKK